MYFISDVVFNAKDLHTTDDRMTVQKRNEIKSKPKTKTTEKQNMRVYGKVKKTAVKPKTNAQEQ